jgi:hypothetical protein
MEFGIQLPALMRGLLTENGIDYKDAEKIVAKYADYLQDAKWFSLDNGQTYDLAFVPKKSD